MGRHSAPDDDEVDQASVAVAAVSTDPGRHARPAGQASSTPAEWHMPGPRPHNPTPPPKKPVPGAAVTEALTEQIPVITDPVVDRPVPEAVTEQIPEIVEPVAAGRSRHETSTDLALVREHADVRARCAAGLLVPFLLYAVALLAIGSLVSVTFLLWIWIPLVTAGVLVGLFLDSGHRRYGTEKAAATGSADRP